MLDKGVQRTVREFFGKVDVDPRDGKIDVEKYKDGLLWVMLLNMGYRSAIDKRYRFTSKDADGDGRHTRHEIESALLEEVLERETTVLLYLRTSACDQLVGLHDEREQHL